MNYCGYGNSFILFVLYVSTLYNTKAILNVWEFNILSLTSV